MAEGESSARKYEWEAFRRNHVIKIEDMLAAYRAFTTMLDAPEYNATFLLEPGQVLVANNWRVLHGRTAIVSPSLRPVLLGAYIEEETFRSRRRLLLGKKSGMADTWLMGCSDHALEQLAERQDGAS